MTIVLSYFEFKILLLRHFVGQKGLGGPVSRWTPSSMAIHSQLFTAGRKVEEKQHSLGIVGQTPRVCMPVSVMGRLTGSHTYTAVALQAEGLVTCDAVTALTCRMACVTGTGLRPADMAIHTMLFSA